MRWKWLISVGLVVCLVLAFALPMCAPAPAPPVEEEKPPVEEEAPPIVPGKVYEWKFFCSYGPFEGACCLEWPILFDKIEKATNGQLKITAYWRGEHPFEGEDALKVMKERHAELMNFYGGYLSAVNPAFAASTTPMLLPSEAFEGWEVLKTLWGGFEGDRSGVLERILEDDWNARMLWGQPASPQRFFTKGYEVTGIGSLKGHKVRSYSPELSKLIVILGGTPVSIGFGETYTALGTGLVDGLITSLKWADAGGMLEVCDTINLWEICPGMDGLMVNRDALAELPPDVRETFLNIMYESVSGPALSELQENALILEKYLKLGYNVYIPSEEARDEVVKRAEEEIWPDWLEAGGSDAEDVVKQAKEVIAGF